MAQGGTAASVLAWKRSNTGRLDPDANWASARWGADLGLVLHVAMGMDAMPAAQRQALGP